jgi:hypothetical protein
MIMTRTATLIGVIFSALISVSAEACRNIVPDWTNFDSYESTFIGEVSGVRLIGYENKKLHLDTCDQSLSDQNIECIDNIAGSPIVKLFVIPEKVFSGTVSGVQALEQVGCTRDDILPKARGIFFVNPGGTTAVVVWRSDQKEYGRWLKRLAAQGRQLD